MNTTRMTTARSVFVRLNASQQALPGYSRRCQSRNVTIRKGYAQPALRTPSLPAVQVPPRGQREERPFDPGDEAGRHGAAHQGQPDVNDGDSPQPHGRPRNVSISRIDPDGPTRKRHCNLPSTAREIGGVSNRPPCLRSPRHAGRSWLARGGVPRWSAGRVTPARMDRSHQGMPSWGETVALNSGARTRIRSEDLLLTGDMTQEGGGTAATWVGPQPSATALRPSPRCRDGPTASGTEPRGLSALNQPFGSSFSRRPRAVRNRLASSPTVITRRASSDRR